MRGAQIWKMAKKVVVVGGGPGGYIAAIRAAQLGAEATVIERGNLGGTCLNVGCIPTKCLLHSAELIENIKNQGKSIGVEVTEMNINFPKIIANKNKISKKLVRGVGGLLAANGVAVVNGEASFVAPGKMEVKTADGDAKPIEADAIILATGSVNTIPPIPGIKDTPACIDSTGALSLEELPATMVVIGAGVIGLEIACAYSAFGTKVTVVEALDHVLPMLDSDVTAVGLKHMKKMGIDINMECPVQSVEATEGGAKVICKNKDGETVEFEAEKVLVAIGRKANTASLDLETGGIENTKGAIVVNDRMQTSAEGIYAIGDCTFGHAQLAHTASLMGEVAAENIMGLDVLYDETTNPTCVYIEPEAAAVGKREDQLEQGTYKVGNFPMAANGKSLILNGGEGLVKIIADAETEKVIGMHMIGPRATDLISEGALAIKMGATVDDVIATIHSHPTVSESLREAALMVQKRPLNMPPMK